MKAELRIGNKLQIGSTIITVDELYQSEFKTPEEGFIDYTHHQLSGIPLTEERLLKMGFENHSPGLYRIKIHPDQARYLETMLTSKAFWDFTIIIEHIYKPEDTEVWIRACHYVHQLQNLYFALTSEELKLA